MTTTEFKTELLQIEANCEHILRREVMETDSLGFDDMVDKLTKNTLHATKKLQADISEKEFLK